MRTISDVAIDVMQDKHVPHEETIGLCKLAINLMALIVPQLASDTGAKNREIAFLCDTLLQAPVEILQLSDTDLLMHAGGEVKYAQFEANFKSLFDLKSSSELN